jgi:hypothetical protein
MSASALGTLLLYLWYARRVSADNQPNAGRLQKKRKKIRSKPTSNSPAAFVTASAAACLAALMAKETAMVLPVVLFAMALATAVQQKRIATIQTRTARFNSGGLCSARLCLSWA